MKRTDMGLGRLNDIRQKIRAINSDIRSDRARPQDTQSSTSSEAPPARGPELASEPPHYLRIEAAQTSDAADNPVASARENEAIFAAPGSRIRTGDVVRLRAAFVKWRERFDAVYSFDLPVWSTALRAFYHDVLDPGRDDAADWKALVVAETYALVKHCLNPLDCAELITIMNCFDAELVRDQDHTCVVTTMGRCLLHVGALAHYGRTKMSVPGLVDKAMRAVAQYAQRFSPNLGPDWQRRYAEIGLPFLNEQRLRDLGRAGSPIALGLSVASALQGMSIIIENLVQQGCDEAAARTFLRAKTLLAWLGLRRSHQAGLAYCYSRLSQQARARADDRSNPPSAASVHAEYLRRFLLPRAELASAEEEGRRAAFATWIDVGVPDRVRQFLSLLNQKELGVLLSWVGRGGSLGKAIEARAEIAKG